MAENEAPHRAGLFDIRVIIGGLIGLYGVILVITGFFTSDAQIAKSDGLNINLWAGLGMVVVSAGFIVWARMRPIVVPADPADAPDEGAERPAH
jgi:hypothetical protein